jgi:glycosyltransferase involved in cell wall biosynthesis
MVGNGELETTLKEAAKSCNNIHFLPFQNQSLMPAVYRLGDIFCLPSQEYW